MSSPAAASTPHARPRAARIPLILLAASALAVALNTLIASVAISAGAPADFGPLTLPAFATFTVVGVLAGWAGWSIVRRRARDPRRTLTVLVPVVLVLSFVPDVMLLILRFIPGTTTAAGIALMAMHLVVAAIAVPAYALASPLPRTRA